MGLFLVPTSVSACAKNKTETSCCKKSEKEEKTKNCCKKEHSENDQDDNDCNGGCGNAACSCSNVQISSFLILHQQEIPDIEISSIYEEIMYVSTIHSQDYYFFWQPPKIG